MCSSDQYSYQISQLTEAPVIHIICFGEQKMLHQLFCVEPLCHPVLTSPFNQHERISFMSVNFYLKIQQLSLYIFFPSCCCDLLAVVPGLSSTSRLPEKVIQRWSLPDFMKDRLANDWCQINVDLGVLVIFGSSICLGGGNFLSHVIILTITRRDTFGCLRSLNPNMVNHVTKQSPLLF